MSGCLRFVHILMSCCCRNDHTTASNLGISWWICWQSPPRSPSCPRWCTRRCCRRTWRRICDQRWSWDRRQQQRGGRRVRQRRWRVSCRWERREDLLRGDLQEDHHQTPERRRMLGRSLWRGSSSSNILGYQRGRRLGLRSCLELKWEIFFRFSSLFRSKL